MSEVVGKRVGGYSEAFGDPANGHDMRLTSSERDELGQVVRNAWVRWAYKQYNPKPSWLVPWSRLPEADREADRCIADELVMYLRMPGLRFRVIDGFIDGVGIEWASQCIQAVGDIECLRQAEGNSVTILCDNPEAEIKACQSAVEVAGDFTGWETERYEAPSCLGALHMAADRARAYYAKEDMGYEE